MKATLNGRLIAESDDVIDSGGYNYFPAESVRRDLLKKADKTASDRLCPHRVQFYDLVVDGKRHARAAWVYERPRASLRHIGGRFGFWGEVEIA